MALPLPVPCTQETFSFGGNFIKAFVPDPAALNGRFAAGITAAPYWGRVWPASLGLCGYLADMPELVAGKHVLELAAGLGLPGLLAGSWAEKVTLSDIEPDAVAVMNASARLNAQENVSSRLIDWAAIPPDLDPDLILLSDINYDPGVFETLYDMLQGFVQAGSAVLLSTPQRLMAKPFIERLLPWCRDRREIQPGNEFVSVFLLGGE